MKIIKKGKQHLYYEITDNNLILKVDKSNDKFLSIDLQTSQKSFPVKIIVSTNDDGSIFRGTGGKYLSAEIYITPIKNIFIKGKDSKLESMCIPFNKKDVELTLYIPNSIIIKKNAF
jgi:hypothetical protein